MLSEQEARALRRIEQQLAADDPKLAARLTQEMPGRPPRWRQRLQDAVIAAVLLSAVVCLNVGAVGAGVAAAMSGIALLWVRRVRSGRRGPRVVWWWRRSSG